MPVIQVNVWEGFGPQKAKAVIEGITEVFVDLDVPAHAVEVLVHEIPKSHWGAADSRRRSGTAARQEGASRRGGQPPGRLLPTRNRGDR